MKKLVPKRRFEGFTDPWEQRKLSELINDIADGPFGSNLKTVHYTNDKEARIIQLSNIGEIGWQDDNVRYTTFEHAKEIKRCIVGSGDLVMAKMMPAGLTIQCPDTDKMYVLSSDAIKIKLNQTLVKNNYFICMTKSSFFLKQINNDAQGSTRTRTSISKVRGMDIVIPTPLEQKQISNFFSIIDNLITLHQRKLDKLKATKSAYFSEMFPKEGELYPKRRFAGFTEPWEVRKLDFLANRFDNLRVPVTASNRISGKVPYYGANGILDYVKGFTHEGEFVLIAEDGANDLYDYPVHYVNGKVWVNNHAHVIQAIDGVSDNKFLKYVFKVFNIEPYLVGGSRAKLNADTMMNLNINTPSVKEQAKIGSFFTNLDSLISTQQSKLNKLQALKNAYLSEMFV
ncbi:MAG: restriction endonuclease subunit S [Tissierellaceae bacterium]